MFRSYLIAVLRNLRKRKFFSLINIAGLSVGLASSMLILLYLHHELSYDWFHERADRIFRVTRAYDYPSGYNHHFARVPEDWINELPESFPEIERLVRLQQFNAVNIRVGEQKFRETNAFATDADVFEVFSFPLLEGDPAAALSQPNSVVLTRAMAEKYFPGGEAIGATIEFMQDGEEEPRRYTVTGIMKDLPSNAHFDVHFLTSIRSPEERTGWAYVYLLLEPGADPGALAAKFPGFISEHVDEPDAAQHNFLHLQPLTDIHLHSDLARELKPNGSLSSIYIFGLTAFFILLLAGVNFVNLSIAQASERTREMGMRKVLGSSRRQLIAYLLGESALLSLAAFALALVLIYYAQPFFFSLTGIQLAIWNGPVLATFATAALLTGLLAGSYPAYRIASVSPLVALKKAPAIAGPAGGIPLRKALVVLQFTISTGLIICTGLTYRQFTFLRDKNLGFNKDQVLAIPEVPYAAKSLFFTFKEEAGKLPGVRSVSAAMEEPSGNIRDTGNIFAEGKVEESDEMAIDILAVDQHFLDLMDISLAAGENFPITGSDLSRDLFPESVEAAIDRINGMERSYMLNEAAVKAIGWENPSEAIGKNFSWSNTMLNFQRGPIVGVTKDFNFSSLHGAVRPLVMVWEPQFFNDMLIKLDPKQIDAALPALQETWNSLFPDYAFDYHFLDESFARLYAAEKQQASILGLFAAIAVFIAALGMLGLAAIAAKQRRRELSIRKIVGASAAQLAGLMAREFVILVLIANLIAWPVSYLLIQEWLQGFAYRISISPALFLLATLGTLLIALLSVGWHTLRAARVNPVEALRQE